MDSNEFENNSCLDQPRCLKELIESGVRIRRRKPVPSRYTSSQHEKTMLIDSALYLVGSANFTCNSLENNAEVVLVVCVESTVMQGEKRFKELWLSAEKDVCLHEVVVVRTRPQMRGSSQSRRSHSLAAVPLANR